MNFQAFMAGFIGFILVSWIVGTVFIVLANRAHRQSGVGRRIRWTMAEPGDRVNWTTATFFNRYDFKTHPALVMAQWAARVIHLLLGLVIVGGFIFVGGGAFGLWT